MTETMATAMLIGCTVMVVAVWLAAWLTARKECVAPFATAIAALMVTMELSALIVMIVVPREAQGDSFFKNVSIIILVTGVAMGLVAAWATRLHLQNERLAAS